MQKKQNLHQNKMTCFTHVKPSSAPFRRKDWYLDDNKIKRTLQSEWIINYLNLKMGNHLTHAETEAILNALGFPGILSLFEGQVHAVWSYINDITWLSSSF